jgi:hypothetical protein
MGVVFMNFLNGMLIFMALGFFLLTAIGIGLHILHGIGIYKLSKKSGDELSWLSFIPVIGLINVFKLAKDSFRLNISEYEITNPYAVVLVLLVISYLPYIGNIGNLGLYLFLMYIYYLLYKIYAPEKATTFAIIGTIFPIVIPLLVFSIRNERRN